MIWHRLDRDKTLDMINRVRPATGPAFFSPASSEGKYSPLPFFESFMIFRLTNFSSLPTFSMDYLSNGETFLYMDGSEESILQLVKQGELVLSEQTVLPYINFYFCYVRLPEGEMMVLKEYAEATHADLYDTDRREELDVHPPEVRIERTESGETFRVTAPVLYDGTPMEVEIIVSADGCVKTTPKRMLTS